jgi:hypothetical protein
LRPDVIDKLKETFYLPVFYFISVYTQYPLSLRYIINTAVLWDATPCGSCKNRCFRGMYHGVLQLLVTANVVPSLPILVPLMMEAIHSSETSVIT